MTLNNLRFAVLVCALLGASAQTENSDNLESCNVVCNCNSGQAPDHTESTTSRLISQGPPGKLGPKGDVGPVGAKGEKGDTGFKGEKGRDADEAFLNHILQAMSTSSCQELAANYGVSTPGYYLMRNQGHNVPYYQYCDFKRYPDVTSCQQLRTRYNISRTGSYIFGRNAESNAFESCGFVYTCHALRRFLSSTGQSAPSSGFYDFDSRRGNGTFRVYCRFADNEAITEVHNNKMSETKVPTSCGGQGCYGDSPRYNVSQDNLQDIIENSVSCKQFVKLRCQNLRFRGEDYAWWISRTGEKMLYWGGTTRDNYCACGETSSCAKSNQKCNCDENAATIRTDEGYLTDKTKLPLREIRVGDLDSSDEHAWYTIGKLECVGQV